MKASRQGRWPKTYRGTLSVVAAIAAAGMWLSPAASTPAAGPGPVSESQVIDSPQFTYTVAQVAYDQPRNLSIGAGTARRLDVVKVIIKGEGFRPKSTGPIVWLNGIATLRTDVSEDGTTVEAYYLEPLPDLEAAAATLGRWELLYQPFECSAEAYRIYPSGDAAGADLAPYIRRFTADQRAQLEALKSSYGIE